MIIKTKLGVFDDETVNQFAENVYLQYFWGYPRFQEGLPFASFLITHFRKRFSADILNKVNEKIELAAKPEKTDDDENLPSSTGGRGFPDDEGAGCRKSGKMILDAYLQSVVLIYCSIFNHRLILTKTFL